ncbi:hypothetical protein [Streptomyces atratus]
MGDCAFPYAVLELGGHLGGGCLERPPRKPKTDGEKKAELRKQRRRLQDAGKRRFFAGQSRW